MFGRGKASKCKELITNVQCRLKLLKNSRRCMVNESRGDVAHLLKHGDYLAAFDRAEQIYKDESLVEIYDLLYDYCQVVSLNLSYISKHKKCPDDINEAVSTLIYASARFGELPELRSIATLLGERYGHRFVLTALHLRPGNLVRFNAQISEVLNMKYVHDYVKYRLLKEIEIASSCDEPGPIEYRPCLEQEKVIESSMSQISSCEQELESMKFSEDPLENSEVLKFLQIYGSGDAADEEEGKPVYVDDGACESVKFSEDPLENSEVLKFLQTYCDDDDDDVTLLGEDSVFNPSSFPLKEKAGKRSYDNIDECIPFRSSRKMRRAGRNRCGRRMESQENITNIESAIYYGYLKEASPESEKEFKNGRKERAKSMVEESYNSTKDILKKLETQATCSRAMSMPIERGNESPAADNISRSKSFPLEERHPRVQYPHPKLPDCDEIEAKFMELKRAHLQTVACTYVEMIW